MATLSPTKVAENGTIKAGADKNEVTAEAECGGTRSKRCRVNIRRHQMEVWVLLERRIGSMWRPVWHSRNPRR